MLKDLVNQFDPETKIPVGRVWLRKHVLAAEKEKEEEVPVNIEP